MRRLFRRNRLGLDLRFAVRISIENVRKRFAAQCCARIALRSIVALMGCSDSVWLGPACEAAPKFHDARLFVGYRSQRNERQPKRA